MIKSTQDGVLHLPQGPDDPEIDPNRECYPTGQGVGAIHEVIPAGDLVHQFVEDAERELARLGALVG